MGDYDYAPKTPQQPEKEPAQHQDDKQDFGSNSLLIFQLSAGSAAEPPPLTDEQQRRRDALRAALFARLEGGVPGIHADLSQLVRAERDEAVVDSLWMDESFRRDPHWKGQGSLLSYTLRELSPLERFYTELRVASARGDAEVLAVVKTWSKEHAGLTETAISEGALDVVALYLKDADKEYEALCHLLFGGTLPTGHDADLQRALTAGDAKRFLAAWSALALTPDALAEYGNDPSWLHRVQTELGDAVYQSVLSDIRFGDRTYLPTELRDRLQEQVLSAVRGLEVLNNSIVWDSTVMKALDSYFQRVDGLLKSFEITEAAQADPVRNLARQSLIDAWKDVHGTDLASKLRWGLQGASETSALAMLAITDAGLPAAEEATADTARAERRDKILRTQCRLIRAQFDVSVYVDDSQATAAIQTAYDTIAEDVALTTLSTFDVHSGMPTAMSQLVAMYDQLYATSLVDSVHRTIQDDGLCHRALTLLGARLDPNARRVHLAMLRSADGETDRAYQAASELSAKVMDYAEQFKGQLIGVAWVSDSNIKTLCRQFGSWQREQEKRYASLGILLPGELLTWLEDAFRSIGGDLRHSIHAGLTAKNADAAFASLGLGNRIEALRAPDETRTRAQLESRRRAEEAVEAVFRAAHSLTEIDLSAESEERDKQRQQRSFDIGTLCTRLEQYLAAQASHDGQCQLVHMPLEPVFREHAGIELGQLLGLVTESSSERSRVERAAKLPSGSVVAERDRPNPDAVRATDPALAIDFTQVTTWDFSLDVAKARAIELHDRASMGKHTALTLTEGGSAEETRVVLQVFERLYGYSLDYLIQREHGFDTGTTRNLKRMAATGGQTDSWLDELRLRIDSRDSGQVVARVMKASQAEHAALLADGELMFLLRQQLSQETYDQVYRVATGQLSLGDVLRQYDEGALGWMGIGWGSDEDGAKTGVAEYIAWVKSLNAGDQQALYQRLFLDREAEAILQSEFGGADLLELRQLLLHGAKRTEDDKLEVGLLDKKKGRDLLTLLAGLPDDQRQLKRRDPAFLQRLTTQLSARDMRLAMDILDNKKGQEHEFTIAGAWSDGGFLDKGKLMDALLAMDAEDRHAKLSDRAWVESVRAQLNAEERPELDRLVKRTAALQAPLLSVWSLCLVDDPFGAPSTEGAMSPADIQRHREDLLLVHSARLRFAAMQGPTVFFPALQKAFGEKGELATDPAVPTATEQLFGAKERKALWDQYGVEKVVASQLGATSEAYQAAKSALLHGVDPSEVALRESFGSWSTDASLVNGALSRVSDDTLLTQWSNILKPGESTANTSLKDVHQQMLLARRDRYSHGGAIDRPATDPVVEQQYLEALARYRNFPLDVSADLAQVLKNDTFWTTIFLSGTTARDYLAFKMAVRKRILALPAASIAKALNIPSDDPAVAELNGIDRKARSAQNHQRDAARHQLGTFSVADLFSDADEQLAVSWALYSGEVGKSAAGEQGEMGEISEEENARIADKLAQFNIDIGEYRAAKDATAAWLKWSAVIVIGALSAAVTGPAGPSLIASMVTAGAQAGTAAILSELAQGNDYDLATEGTRSVVIDTAMAGLSHQSAKAFTTASRSWGPARAAQAQLDRFNKLGDDLSAALRDSGLLGEGLAIGVDSARAASLAQLKGISAPALALVDPKNLQYGWDYGVAKAQGSLQAKLEGMDDAWYTKFREELFTQTVATARKRLKGSDPSVVPGSEDALPKGEADPETTFLMWLATDSRDAAIKQLIGHAAKLNGKGKLFSAEGWNDEAVAGFLDAYVSGRVKSLNGYMTKQIKGSLAMDTKESLSDEVRKLAEPGEDAEELVKLYQAHLKAHGGQFELTPEAWRKGYWKPLQRDLERQTAGADPAVAAEYRSWVLEAGTAADGRAQTSLAEYTDRRTRAANTVAKIRASSEYAALSAEQKALYEVYVSDPKRVMSFVDGKPGEALDLRVPAYRKRFVEAARETKRQLATVLVTELTADWPAYQQKEALDRLKGKQIDGIPSLELAANSAENRERLATWLEWTRKPKPQAHPGVYGEFLGPY